MIGWIDHGWVQRWNDVDGTGAGDGKILIAGCHFQSVIAKLREARAEEGTLQRGAVLPHIQHPHLAHTTPSSQLPSASACSVSFVSHQSERFWMSTLCFHGDERSEEHWRRPDDPASCCRAMKSPGETKVLYVLLDLSESRAESERRWNLSYYIKLQTCLSRFFIFISSQTCADAWMCAFLVTSYFTQKKICSCMFSFSCCCGHIWLCLLAGAIRNAQYLVTILVIGWLFCVFNGACKWCDLLLHLD